MMKNDLETNHKAVIRFTEEEYAFVKENVRKCRLFTQSYFRILISGRRPVESPSDDYWEIHNSLRKIRINLMQIAGKAEILEMQQATPLWAVAYAFHDHCTKILNLMLRIENP